VVKTRVVNIRHEPYDVYIGRSGHGIDGRFGNPYKIEDVGGRENAIQLYEEYFAGRVKNDAEFRKDVLALKGRVLGCHCRPAKCHGDIIVAYLETPEPPKQMRLL